MLKIHKHSSKKYLIILSTSICSIGALLGFSTLTYTPELSHAESVVYPEPKPPEIHPNLSDITYMQEITQEICTNSKMEEQYQLKDTRDQKMYWVAKLKDNNCWMTQNLDYDLNTAKPLTSADSNVTSSWTPKLNTQTTAVPDFTDNANTTQSWDPSQGEAEIYCLEGNCKNISTISSNGGHDSQGNYYSWAAATVGQTSTSSICPKGWRLPSSGSNNTSNGSFYRLVNGLTKAQIMDKPYYFVQGG